MARPKKDVSAYIGQRIEGTKLTVLREVGRDSRGRILVEVQCECEARTRRIVVLSEVLSGHTVSCGCRKHENHVKYIQQAVDNLTSEELHACFLSNIDSSAPKPDLPRREITSAFIRYRDALKARLDSDLAGVRKRVMANRLYTDIAKEFNLHPADVAWLAKHVIRPEARQQHERKENALNAIRAYEMGRYSELEYLEKLECRRQSKLRDAKRDYQERLRMNELRGNRFSAAELHDPGTKACQKARQDPSSLDSAWEWMREEAPRLRLTPEDQELVDRFHEAGERTFQWRREQRRAHIKMISAKQARVSDAESVLVEYDVAA